VQVLLAVPVAGDGAGQGLGRGSEQKEKAEGISDVCSPTVGTGGGGRISTGGGRRRPSARTVQAEK
jgi:hypothetical protein